MTPSPFRFAPRRPLGKTGFSVTRLGAGDLADRSAPIEALAATLRRAFDAGVNLVDTAPNYEDGYSEQVVGAALKGRREGIFVVDKIDHPDRPVAPQLEASLGRLELDRVDLCAFHSVSSMATWEGLAAPGGGLDQLDRCIERGLARFRGLSSHHPDVLVAALESGRCDVVMFPVGPFCDERYLTQVLPLAHRRGVGTIGFKAFGAGMLLGDCAGYGRPLDGAAAIPAQPRLPRLSVEECLRYTLTLDPDVALLGLSNPAEQDLAFAAAERFAPMPPEELAALRRRAAEAIEGKGEVWWNP